MSPLSFAASAPLEKGFILKHNVFKGVAFGDINPDFYAKASFNYVIKLRNNQQTENNHNYRRLRKNST